MYLVEDRTGAIILMVLALFCLGSWPVFFNILEQRGRLPQHTYLDYAFSTFFVAVLFALTVGEIGTSVQNFTTQLMQIQDNWISAIIAMSGGVALCLGNIAMQFSLAYVGVSLTQVVSASFAVAAGTAVNYYLDNGLNQANILFPGVACFLVAVILGAICHASNASDIHLKLEMASEEGLEEQNLEDFEEMPSETTVLLSEVSDDPESYKGGNNFIFKGSGSDNQLEKQQHSAGSAEFLHHIEQSRAIKIRGSSVSFGLSIALLTGCCYALFSPLVNIATNDQFNFLKDSVAVLSVYTTFFYFSAAFLICGVLINIYLLYHPVLGLPKSSISSYVMDNEGRSLAILAGVVCTLGNGFQFMGGEAAGYAAAESVQALPLVGTFWGIILFGEYHESSRKTYGLLIGMLAMFIIGISLLIASSQERF